MLFYLIFIEIISFTTEKIKIFDELLIIEQIFNNNLDFQSLNTVHCKIYNYNMLTYRGRPTNIKDIINMKNKEDYSDYKYVYISDLQYLDKVVEFPKSTIFFTFSKIMENEAQLNKEYCYINIDWKLEYYFPLYYMIIGLNVEEKTDSYINLDI